MRAVPGLAAVFVAGALLATTGCVRWTRLAPADLQIHGKLGQACSAAVTPVVWSVNTALFPVSVAVLGRKPASHDNLGYPGLAVENAAYFTCAALGLPLHALCRGAEMVYFLLADREAVEDHLIERLPDLTSEDYARLVRIAGRAGPPRYGGDTASRPPPVPGAASPREFGLWSTGHAPRFGSKPRLGNLLAAAEWRDWRTAGRPRNPSAETAFIVNRALGFADPALQFAATYDPGQTSRFEQELAAQQLGVAAMDGAGVAAAVDAARHDPSPNLRAAAARRLARSGEEETAGELTRLLADPAVVVRAAAADALAARADSGSAAALGDAMDDPNPFVRERAALALGKIGSEAAATRLLPSLGKLGHRARFEALCALAGSPRAREALAPVLEDPDLHTRIAVAAAIGRTAADAGDPLFLRASTDPDRRISETAVHARERRGERCAIR